MSAYRAYAGHLSLVISRVWELWKNAVYLFDNDALEANPNAYEETKQDLGSLLLEALNRP